MAKTKKIKILYLTYYWPPSGGPGVQRALKFTKYFNEFNIEPYILTVDEKKASYPLIDYSLKDDISKGINIFKTNSFEPLEIYRRLNKQKEIPYSGFVNIDKTSLFQKFFRFIRGNFFIPDARVGWNRYAFKMAERLIMDNPLSAIVTSSPPHSTQLVGLKLKRKYNLPWIADMRDPWTDIYYYNDFYHLPFIKRYDASLERKVLENADAVVVVSKSIKKLFISKSDKINPDKIHVIPNGFDEEDFMDGKNMHSDEFIITYTGTLSDQYPVDTFVAAFSKIVKEHTDIKIKFNIVGKVSDNILNKFMKYDLSTNVDYMGYKKHKEAVSFLSKSNALLLVIPDITNNAGILTGKLFEYLGSRKPILNLGPVAGDAAKIINECKAGKTFDYLNEKDIINYLIELIEDLKVNNVGKSNDNVYLNYSRRRLTERFSNLIKEIILTAK